MFCAKEKWPWKPLQHILQAYLGMIEEGKVTTYSDPQSEAPGHLLRFFPWEIHQQTQRDVEMAVESFIRLLDAIKSRLPPTSMCIDQESSDRGMAFPHLDSMIDDSFTQRDSFARCFLSALPNCHINFRYIAPGIRVQSPEEFITQPFAERRDTVMFPRPFGSGENSSSIPLLLFRGDGENKSPWTRPWFPDGEAKDIPAGLYIEPIDRWRAEDSGNESRLLLPFKIGANKYARSSNGVPFSKWALNGVSDKLYRVYCFSGVLPLDSHSSQLHKVLLNWTERVEMGDWEVNEDGVAGGIEKFKEADTPEHWKKYHVSW